jgi:hypothetical protein
MVMDPISIIVGAMVLGASEGLKSTAAQAVKEAYAGLRAFIVRKYGDHSGMRQAVASLENKPDSKDGQEVLKQELAAAGGDRDQEVVDEATSLLKLLEHVSPGVTGGLVGQINAAGGKVIAVGRDVGQITM